MPESEKKLPDEVSRATIKRNMTTLQKIGETLIDLAKVN